MKSLKKVLGALIALSMLFNVFAICVSAAYPTDSVVGLELKTDKTVYAPGEEIVLTFNAKAIDSISGGLRLASQNEIAYNSAIFEPYSDSATLNDHAFVPNSKYAATYDAGNSQVLFTSDLIDGGMTDIYADDKSAYGWDSLIAYWVAEDASETTSCENEALEIATVKMKIKADAPNGTYTIGFNQYGYDNYNAYVTDANFGGLYGTGADMGIEGTYAGYLYDCGVATITVGEAVEEKLVYHVKNQIQWADKDANTVNLGVVAGFDVEDIAINFDDFGTSTDVTAVGAKVTINGKDDTKTERFVYAMNDGNSYYFRAVIENVSADYEGDIVVTPFVEKGEDTFEGDPVTINAEELTKLVAKLPA